MMFRLFVFGNYKALVIIQIAPATARKNKPSPTGDPQLNQEPHARQCFCERSYQSICSSGVILAILRLLI